MDNIKLEFVIHKKKDIEVMVDNYRSILRPYIVSEGEDKVTLNVSKCWDGFKDGTFARMMSDFGPAMYVAIAYFGQGGPEIVTDFTGSLVSSYEQYSGDGKRIHKYIKKKLRIINIIDKERNVFKVVGYALDFKISPPVVKVLDVYSGSIDSGVGIDNFK